MCLYMRQTLPTQGKEFSYSEMDLRKPKRFATFSFGLRKRKKNDQASISKSTYGLHGAGIEEQKEIPPLELDQAKTIFSMSQPELDTIDTFDIPSPPPVTTDLPGSHATCPDQALSSVALSTPPETMERLPAVSDVFDVHVEPQKPPDAFIPELELHNQDSAEEKPDCSSPPSASTTQTESRSALDNQTVPGLPASTPTAPQETSVHEVDSAAATNGPFENDILQQSHANAGISLTESTTVPLSHRQPDVPATSPKREPSLARTDSKIDPAVAQSTLLPRASAPDPDSASINQEDSTSGAERSAPLKKTAGVSAEKGASPVRQEAVYGALYESLFPQGFSSDVAASLSNPPPQIITEIRSVKNQTEPFMVKTLNDCGRETNVHFDSASLRVDDAVAGYASVNTTFSERKGIDPSESSGLSSYQTSTACEARREPDVYSRHLPSSLNSGSETIPYAETTPSLSEMKSDSLRLIQDNARSVLALQSSTPPASDCGTIQGGDTRVTRPKRRAILIKESVTEEASTDPVGLAPTPEKMSAAKRLEVRIETMETFSTTSGQTDGSEGFLSPAYLSSVGSEEGSMGEIYYSAEEDNGMEEDGSPDERVESCGADGGQEAGLCEEFPQRGQIADGGIEKREDGEFQEVIVKMQNEGVILASKEEKEDANSHLEKLGGWSSETETTELVVGSDTESREEEVAAPVFPQLRDEGELPATPVQQVETPMVCDFAPPPSEPREEGSEGNLTGELETEDHPNGETQLPSQEIPPVGHRTPMSSECINTASSSTGDTITPRSDEAEEQVSPTAVDCARMGEVSKEGNKSGGSTPGRAVTDASAGGESDATGVDHNSGALSSEWVETITESTDRTTAVDADTRRPDPEAAETPSQQPDPTPRSLTASTTPTAAPEFFASVNLPSEAEMESVDEVTSGYSRISTNLYIKASSPPEEDESKSRFRKVSLINEANATEVSRDTADFSHGGFTVSDSNDTEIGSEYRWRNRFEGLSQFTDKREGSSFSDSLSYRMSDSYSSSSSSTISDSTEYKHLSNSSSYSEEQVTTGNMTKTSLSYDIEGAPTYEWRRRSLDEQVEPAAPASEREAEAERFKSRWDSQQLPVSSISSARGYDTIDGSKDDDDVSRFTGVFTATLVELVSEPAAPPSTPPASPEEDAANQFDMDNLVDTLRSMGPSQRPRNGSLRGAPAGLMSSLPPIVEDASSPVSQDIPARLLSPTKRMEATDNPPDSLKGLYTLPSDLGLGRNSSRDTRSPLELMSQQVLQSPGTRGLALPLRSSATNSSLTKLSDSSTEELKSPQLNGNGFIPSSRLDKSIIFGSHKSTTIDQTNENGTAHRPLFRTISLPDKGPSYDAMSLGQKELGEPGTGTEPAASRFERLSFLSNSSSSQPGSVTGAESPNAVMSLPPLWAIGSPPSSNSPNRLLSPTGSVDLQRPLTTVDSAFAMFGQTQGMGTGTGAPILLRSSSIDGNTGVQQTALFNRGNAESQFQSQAVEPERNLASKYRAFPDAYLTKEKEHGKLNPRPGKMYIFDRPGMCGQRIEVRSDVIDATPWELQETISIRVVRGGWVLYEKPNFKGEKIALDEGDIELTYPFNPEEELQNGEKEAGEPSGETSDVQSEPARRFIIGSLRRAVRDYSVPEIRLFPEESAEGKKVIFRDTSEDARIFGFPIKANSIIVNAGLWLVYAHPFFQGLPRVLEVGGYSNPAAWGVEQPYVGSLHPLKVGEPRVENMSQPKLVIYDKPYFTGKSRTITTNMRDFVTRADRQQTTFIGSAGSLKVHGGIWVGYEKEGFRGHQYLLEEGEYHDWRVWGGHDAELRSVRVIRADLTDPVVVLFEQPDEEPEGAPEENTFEVTEAIADVELFEYKTSTRSIHVLSGAWVAYSHVDFSGNQYILEKGVYNNCADWGSEDTRICSVQPILRAPSDSSSISTEIILYSEPDFQGECHVYKLNQEALSEKVLTKSCRVSGGSWVLYENKQYSGNSYVLSEGDYPSLTSMGCPPDCTLSSVKVVPMTLSVPSISLFGLECLEGRKIDLDTEVPSMVEEGFNNHILSVRVNSGCWVICEHSNYRGRQFLLEPIEITNWPKFSSIQSIGSMFPVRQKRHFLRIKNQERGHFLSVQGGVEEMKSGRVVVTPEVEPMSDIWFYQDGFIKSKLSPTMSLQVIGNIEQAAKVVLWTETRQPVQTWTAQMRGLISSLTFPGCVLDVKGGKSYDKDHVVIMPENEERPSQQWEIELL
uniref:Beta/gamma crystallin 'Greek key' domain-containing protein n=1 Tax=Gasterosteus aculeatus aculeatus TaxID=481459 RepID=A0AAQ4P373_GASAC